jgi:hypothetical protein
MLLKFNKYNKKNKNKKNIPVMETPRKKTTDNLIFSYDFFFIFIILKIINDNV